MRCGAFLFRKEALLYSSVRSPRSLESKKEKEKEKALASKVRFRSSRRDIFMIWKSRVGAIPHNNSRWAICGVGNEKLATKDGEHHTPPPPACETSFVETMTNGLARPSFRGGALLVNCRVDLPGHGGSRAKTVGARTHRFPRGQYQGMISVGKLHWRLV